MGKFLYPIYKLKLPSYKRWWLYYKASGGSGVLSDLIEGDYLVLNNSLPKVFNLLQLVGNTIQDGEPSPENEVPILNVTGKVNTKIQNKNLLEITENSLLVHCTYVSGANTNEYKLLCTQSDMYVNEVQSVGTSYNKLRNGNLISCKYGEQIYFNTGNDLFIKNFFTEFDENFISLGNYNKVMSSGTYTPTNQDCKYVTLRFGYGSGAVAGTTYTLAPIVCKTSDTSYVEHQEQNLPLDLRSKNLINISTLVYGYVTTSGNFSDSYGNGEMRSTFLKVKPNTSYVFSIKETNSNYDNWIGIGEYTSKNTTSFIRRDTMSIYNQRYIQFTTSSTTEYIVVSARNLVEDTKIQLEQGTEATDYVPYYNYELSKIGDAEDYFYKENGKWYLHKEVEKENNLVFTQSTIENNLYISTNRKYKVQNALCNYFINVVNENIVDNSSANNILQNNQFSMRMGTKDRFYVKTDLSLEQLNALNSVFYIILETPINIEITETPLINQLEAFSKAKAYEGQTIIYGESEEAVPNYKVKYYMKGE